MINLSITWWELALIIIAIAFVVLVIYLVRLLKQTNETMTQINGLVNENKRYIDGIVENVNTITKDATQITGKVENVSEELIGSVSAVNQDVIHPLITTSATAAKVLQTVVKRKEPDSNKSA